MADSTTAPSAPTFHWLQDVNSVLASAIFHLTALVALGLVSASISAHSGGDGLVVQLGDGNDAVNGDEGRLPGGPDSAETAIDETDNIETQVADQTLDQLAFKPVLPADEILGVSSDLEPIVADLSAALATSDTLFPDVSSASSIDKALVAAGGFGRQGKSDSGDGKDAASGRGSPWGKEDGFFGIGDYGKSLVYVVDCSDSMNENNKFERMCYELIRALESFSESQRYFVVFFNDGAYPMDADGPVEATAAQVERTRRWLIRIVPGGGTNPLPALRYALTMDPDAIYFLSDGQFDPLVIQELKGQDRNSHKTPIHTISFVNRETIGIMKTISRNSGGKFRFVK